MKTNLRIGEVLMERGCITQEQMEQALAYQKEHREKRVGQILIELGFITETHVLEALAARLGLEIVSIGQMQVDLSGRRVLYGGRDGRRRVFCVPCRLRRCRKQGEDHAECQKTG